ncbi:ASPIC/UnbV domain-containing protein, partial [Rhodopirellula maiorica SM1]
MVADPSDVQALLIAGNLAGHQRDFQSSLSYYQEAIRQSKTADMPLLDNLTQSLLRSGRVFDAIELLKTFIERFEGAAQARFDLAGLMTMVGIPESSTSYLHWLFQHNQGDVETLLLMAHPARIEPDLEFCDSLLERSVGDIRLRYAAARVNAMRLQWEEVVNRLEAVVEQHPDFAPALVLYGRGLVELERIDELEQWKSRLPAQIVDSPEYWIVMGKWAEAVADPQSAAHAFLQVQRLNGTCYPDQLNGLYRNLLAIDDEPTAQLVEVQIQRQIGLRDSFKIYLDRDRQSQTAAFAVAESMVDLGRVWEGEAWARHAVGLPNETTADAKQRYLAIRDRLSPSSPWILSSHDLASMIRVRGNPNSQSLRLGSNQSPTNTSGALRKKSQIPLFQNEAKKRGFDHTCAISADAESKGHWLHQSSGGGVGVIDFDLDSYPDLAVAMLDGEPLQANSSANRLFRNLGGQFVEVGDLCGYDDTGFSQGIAIGDINCDGFADIFDANIGQNRVFINNGDGTFREASESMGMHDESWSVSAAIADLDADGNADIFAANYCDGTRPFEHA